MARIDLNSLSIGELAGPRENATDTLFENSRRTPRRLEAELEKLAQYGKPVKKAESAPVPKAKETEDAREPKEQVAKAASRSGQL